MRRFVLQVLAFMALQAGLLGALAWRYPPDPKTYYAATRLKHDRLSSLASPRLILVGGSGTTFGIDSATLERALHLATVNMSLHADLGVDFMLNEVEPAIRPGDVVLLSLEYEHFFADQTSWDRALLPVLEQRPQSMACLGGGQLKKLADHGLGFVGHRTRQWLRYLRGKQRRPAAPPYVLESFNDYGDVVGHYTMDSTDERNEGWRIARQLDTVTLHAVTERLNRFVALCRSRGGTVFFAYPSTTENVFREIQPAIHEIQQHLSVSLNCPILDDPRELVWPVAFFFNSKYHLNQAGATRRTAHLLERLEAKLAGKPAPRTETPPLQPARPANGM